MSDHLMTTDPREEWLAERRKAIGASDVAAILGVSRWATPWEVWAEKTGRLEAWKGNAATRAGIALEPVVLDYAEESLGPLSRDQRVPAIGEGVPLVATCDAIVVDSGCPVEAKTTGITGPVYGEWGDASTDEVPEAYLLQVHAQLICTGAEVGYLFALIPGRGIVEYVIEPHEALHRHLCERLAEWWERYVVADVAPPLEPMPSLDVVRRLRREPNKVIDTGEEFARMVDQWERAKAERKAAEDQVRSVERDMLLILDDAEQADLTDGRRLTYLQTNRRGYTVEPCTYRCLRVKGRK